MKNNKGFTLIELIGVIGILTLVLLVAIPNIVSTYERNKNKIKDQKTEIILDAAEMYVNLMNSGYYDHNFYDREGFKNGTCGFSINDLIQYNLITEEDLQDSEGNAIYDGGEFITYNKNEGIYEIDKPGVYEICGIEWE